MEIMATPTSITTQLWAPPSYAPSLATCEPAGDTFVAVTFLGGCVRVDADAPVTRELGADVDLASTTSIIRNARNKDIRPGSRAWSPPV